MSTAETAARRKRHRAGKRAETAAMLYLLGKGYLPLFTRFKTPVGEIDLVMRRGRTLVFVEVKARTAHADAAHAIHAQNQSRVVRAAQYFIAGHPNYGMHNIRFDAVLIAWYRWPRHLVHAFS